MSIIKNGPKNSLGLEFQLHTVETAPAGSRATLESAVERQGYFPNIWAVLAESPAALKGYVALLMSVIQEGALSTPEVMLVLLTVSRENECRICVPINSTYGLKFGLDEATVQAVRQSEPIADARLAALHDLAVAIVETRGKVDQAEVEAFFAAGYDKAHLLDVLALIGAKTITNYLTPMADIPLDEMYQDYAWEPEVA